MASVSGTQRYARKAFDYANRETFVSFPSTSSTPTTGTNTTYDALGRVTGTAQNSELGTLTTQTRYLSPFTAEFTNARGKISTTTFQAFDEPDTSAPLVSSEPLSVTTAYTRDVFGKPLTLARSGTYSGSPISQTRQYVYDVNQLLCKTIEAESGATLLSYNASNLVEWKASGQSLTDPANCQTGSVVANQKVSYDYDQRDRLWRTRYGDGSPSVTLVLTPDGLPESVQSDNSTWNTLYNKRRLMTSETLTLSGVPYQLSYTHSPNGHVASLTYPDGNIVAYAPNALGEATQVGSYASGITRHPNGALATLTYGNGIAHTTQQNVRGLPSRSTDAGVLDDIYSYDENANVAAITDNLGATFTRSMGYDDRDRLTSTTNGPLWGGAHTFVYDPLDNLRRADNPTFGDWTYAYNVTTQRLDRIDPTAGGNAILTYGYDVRGRATSRALAGTSQTFVVDLADRVTSIEPSVATYRYDGYGRRTSVTKASTTTVQVYSQAGQLLYQSAPTSDGIFRSGFQSSDTPYPASAGGNKRYIYMGRHLIAEDGATARSYVHTDGLGSPARTTSAGGVSSGREDYKPYGWGPTPQSKPGFTGHVADAETGLSYMQARYYDPFAGRFLAVDPVGASSASFNRYWYANNNPYKNVDPDGRLSRGTGFTDKQWQRFDRAQQRAASNFDKAAAKIAGALQTGRGMKEVTKAFEKSFGPGSATPGNMAKVAGDMSAMAAALQDTGPSAIPANALTPQQLNAAFPGAGSATLAGVPTSGPKQVVVNVGHSEFTNPSTLAWGVGHEMGHAILGYNDQRFNGYKAYKFGDPDQRSSFQGLPGQQRLVNPDHLMDFSQ